MFRTIKRRGILLKSVLRDVGMADEAGESDVTCEDDNHRGTTKP